MVVFALDRTTNVLNTLMMLRILSSDEEAPLKKTASAPGMPRPRPPPGMEAVLALLATLAPMDQVPLVPSHQHKAKLKAAKLARKEAAAAGVAAGPASSSAQGRDVGQPGPQAHAGPAISSGSKDGPPVQPVPAAELSAPAAEPPAGAKDGPPVQPVPVADPPPPAAERPVYVPGCLTAKKKSEFVKQHLASGLSKADALAAWEVLRAELILTIPADQL